MKISIVISIIFFSCSLCAQSKQAAKKMQAGNELYRQQQFEQAASEYNKAVEADPADNQAKFNLANALYQQKKREDAAKLFTGIITDSKEPELKTKAYYNKGVTLSREKKLEESIEAYKSALRLSPDDKEIRENLQKALLELKKKNPPKKKDEKEKKKKQDQDQQQKQQSKMSPREAEQKLKLLEQKEKEVQQRLQQQKAKTGGSQIKDW